MQRYLMMARLVLLYLLLLTDSSLAAPHILDLKAGKHEMSQFNKTDVYRLSGEWLYFPDKILEPQEFLQDSQKWLQDAAKINLGTGFTDGDKPLMKSSQGYASYLLQIDNVPEEALGIWGLAVFSSARLYFFASDGSGADQPTETIGHFSKLPKDNQPQMTKQHLALVKPYGQQTHYVLIQVGNFHHSWGGVWIPPVIASADAAVAVFGENQRYNYLLMGVTLFVAIYSLGLFLRRREDLASFWLFAYAIERSIRTFWYTNNGADWLNNFKLSYEFNYKLQWFFWLPSTILLIFFFRSCFPKQTPRWAVPAFSILCGLPLLYALFTPVIQHYDLIKLIYSVANPLVGLFVVFVILRAYRAKEEGAHWLVIGLVVMVSGGVIDILYTLGINLFSFNNISGVSMAFFLICQSQIVAHRSAQAFRKAEFLSRELRKEVERQTRDIKSILDTIKQGIFSVHSSEDAIDPQYSAHLVEIAGTADVSTRNLKTLLLERSNLDSDQRAQIVSCLDASLGEDMLNFEMNVGNLVQEINYRALDGRDKVLEVDWIPMLDQQQVIEKILINLRDVTDVRQLEARTYQQEEDLKILIELIHIPEDRFHRFLNKTKEYLKQNRDLVMEFDESRPEVIKQLFVNMHTIKGTARTYLLRAISNATHEVEEYYQKLSKGQQGWDRQTLLDDITRVEELVEKYRNVGAEKLGWNLSERLVKIPSSTLESVVTSLNEIAHDYLNPHQRSLIKAVKTLLFNSGFVRVQDVIEEACRGLDSIARDLEKHIPLFAVDMPLVVMRDQGVNLMHGILVHLLRNSMDHGIEKPAERSRLGKKEEGTIYISAKFIDQVLRISYHDDGAGLNLESIRQKAISKGLIQANAKLSALDIGRLIFEAGLSTKSAVSDISGRGVGLDAVKRYVEQAGGKVNIVLAGVEDITHVAFHFEIDVPEALCIPLEVEFQEQLAS